MTFTVHCNILKLYSLHSFEEIKQDFTVMWAHILLQTALPCAFFRHCITMFHNQNSENTQDVYYAIKSFEIQIVCSSCAVTHSYLDVQNIRCNSVTSKCLLLYVKFVFCLFINVEYVVYPMHAVLCPPYSYRLFAWFCLYFH